jgi:alanine or glycine:cation symporter, AGCS family
MQTLDTLISYAGDFLWGIPGMAMLLLTGLYLTIMLRGLQFWAIWHALYLALIVRKDADGADGDINHFQALMTALAATVGTGNIVGVATAILLGGPGALFWMWMTGLVGMATKYAEAVLAVKYRVKGPDGQMSGGPMYYLSRGLGSNWLAKTFALCGGVAAFGIGNMVQSNSVAGAVGAAFGVPAWVTGLLLAVATGAVVIGGIRSIGRITGVLVPFMIVVYMVGAIYILLIHVSEIPQALALVVREAFNPSAVGGGAVGITIWQVMRYGVARGIFSNESGLGSSPIAAAAAVTKHPVTQALVSMTQTFIDTIVVCSMTGLVIILTGFWNSTVDASQVTALAFESVAPGYGSILVSICLSLFAYSTILGWCYYGEKSIGYIGGERIIGPYRVIFVLFVFCGSVLKIDLVWNISDVMNGMMMLPNLVGLIGLAHVVKSETLSYFQAKLSA